MDKNVFVKETHQKGESEGEEQFIELRILPSGFFF